MIRKKINAESDQDQDIGRSDIHLGRKNISSLDDLLDMSESVKKREDENIESSLPSESAINDTSTLTSKLASLFGLENINSIRIALADIGILPAGEGDRPELWLTNIFDSYFTSRQVNNLCDHYNTYLSNLLQAETANLAIISSLKTEVLNIQDTVKLLESTLKTKEEAIDELNRRLKNTLPANTVLQQLCNELPFLFENLKTPLLDEAGDDILVKFKFVLKLITPLHELSAFLSQEPTESEENVERASGYLRELLSSILGLHIIRRRDILDIVAGICTNNISNLMFISPESSVVVDPLIHNIKGLNGNTVKEGVSYAILRKDSRQVIKLADITVI